MNKRLLFKGIIILTIVILTALWIEQNPDTITRVIETVLNKFAGR
ncbi:Uncharacterised protein [uncultured Clostridium sp.]|nr:Uncharacterised protein [uncultured Clostridium sp.]